MTISYGRGRSRGGARQIAVYFGLAYLFYYLCTPTTGLASVAIQWLLKNRLNLPPQKVASFQLVIAAPTYIAFLFGLARDRFSFFGKGDQGVLWLFAPLMAVGYGWAAMGRATPLRILLGILLVVLASRFVLASLQGLTAGVGQRHAMTGLLSTVWNTVATVLVALSFLVGGFVTESLGYAQTFGLLGTLALGLLGLGFWRPPAVFGNAREPCTPDKKTHLGHDILQIARHRAIWPAVIIWTLWQFAPGMTTPLLFYLTDHLHSTATQFGYFNAVFSISFVPTYLLYGLLCRRVKLRWLLLGGTILAVPQMIPLLFLHGAAQAIWMAIPIGLTGGVATAAYMDLILRSCPRGLEGTAMMIAEGGYFIALRFGDVFGAWLYEVGGFALTAWITTGVYALILPMLLFVPRAVSETHDQPAPAAEISDEPMTEVTLAH